MIPNLRKLLHHRIKLHSKDKKWYEGDLLAVDENTNVVVNDTEEYRKSNKSKNIVRRFLGLVIFRGDSVVSVEVIGKAVRNNQPSIPQS